jgi:hypothetical protein
MYTKTKGGKCANKKKKSSKCCEISTKKGVSDLSDTPYL